MPKRKDLKMDEYNISTYCYRELYNFCMQHRERLSKLNGSDADPAAQQNRADVEVVLRSALEASPLYWKQLLKSVTEQDIRYETLRHYEGLHIGERKFRALRRKFFYILAKNLKKI